MFSNADININIYPQDRYSFVTSGMPRIVLSLAYIYSLQRRGSSSLVDGERYYILWGINDDNTLLTDDMDVDCACLQITCVHPIKEQCSTKSSIVRCDNNAESSPTL